MAPLPVPKEPLPSLRLPFQTAFALRFITVSVKRVGSTAVCVRRKLSTCTARDDGDVAVSIVFAGCWCLQGRSNLLELLLAGSAFDQLRDRAGFRHERHVTRCDLDRMGG